MNATDVAALIARINALDPRIANTPNVVDAWDDLLRSTVPDMPLAWAIGHVPDHTTHHSDRALRPGDLITAWNAQQRTVTPTEHANLDSHCGRRGCPCAHRRPCYRGFNDDNPGQFCRSCNPTRQAAIDRMPPPGQRTQFDFHTFITQARNPDPWEPIQTTRQATAPDATRQRASHEQTGRR